MTQPWSASEDPLPQEAKTWGIVCHLAGLAGLTAVPFASIACPLVVWLLKRDTHPFVDYCGREALNFQISFTIYIVLAAVSALFLIGFLLLPLVVVVWLALTVIAGVKTSNGERYAYPLIFRLI